MVIATDTTLETLLTRLVNFKTYSRDHAENRKALDWIADQIASTSLHVAIVEVGGFPSLIATTKPTRTPRLWLQAHLDVVPGSDAAFQTRVEGTKMVGRGTFDMKYAIASYIKLAWELSPELARYDFGIMITTDEEIGGEHGVKALLDQGYHSGAAFLPDGGKDWQFVSASRGIWHLQATATGESQHGSRPWLGQNAIVSLMRFLEELLAVFPKEPCGQADHFHNSITVGTISGGKAVNQIPDSAEAQCDIRYVVEDHEHIKDSVTQLLRKHPAIAVKTIAEGSGYRVDRENAYFKTYERLLQTHGVVPSFEVTHGSSDARHFAAQGIPAIVLRPTGGGHHSEYEWIDMRELERFHVILQEFVRQTTGQ